MLRMIVFILISFSTSSCTTILKVDSVPAEYSQKSLKYFVENHGTDGRRLDRVISSELRNTGLDTSNGYENERPDKFDILVVYEDRWHWDMGTYLVYMRIDLRSPETNVLLETGSSYQSSLTRKNHNLVVKDIITGMFN